MAPEVEDEDALYGLPVDGFTAARNELVKRLKKAGEKERAASVGKLRRPALTAWALNQVARQEPALVAEVFAAGDALREAMDAAVAGDASAVRSAQAAERDAVEAAVAAALGHLAAAGSPGSEDARWRMSQTLRAALVDEGAADRLRHGTMDVDIEASGFGTFGFGDVISAPGRVAKTKAAVPDLAEAPEVVPDEGQSAAEAAEAAAIAEARRAARDRAATLDAGAARLAEDAERLELAAREQADRAARAREAAAAAEAEAAEAEQAAADARRLATASRAEADAARAALDDGTD